MCHSCISITIRILFTILGLCMFVSIVIMTPLQCHWSCKMQAYGLSGKLPQFWPLLLWCGLQHCFYYSLLGLGICIFLCIGVPYFPLWIITYPVFMTLFFRSPYSIHAIWYLLASLLKMSSRFVFYIYWAWCYQEEIVHPKRSSHFCITIKDGSA